MFGNIKTKLALSGQSAQITAARAALDEAEAVIIGAGAGLSTAAGFTYSGERFRRHFADFAAKYRFRDMYSGGFYPYDTPEEFWAFWSRNIYINRYEHGANPLYEQLLALVRGKDYFVLTTNVDHQFQLAGFDRGRLFYTQGDYGLLQCSEPCHQKTYDNEDIIRQMLAAERDMRVPAELIPRCPVCGRPMSLNLRSDDTFVEDDGWHAADRRYRDFLARQREKRVVFLELGTGYNTPGIIKYPFWQMTGAWPQAQLITVNIEDASVPEEIAAKSICIAADIKAVLEILAKETDIGIADENC